MIATSVTVAIRRVVARALHVTRDTVEAVRVREAVIGNAADAPTLVRIPALPLAKEQQTETNDKPKTTVSSLPKILDSCCALFGIVSLALLHRCRSILYNQYGCYFWKFGSKTSGNLIFEVHCVRLIFHSHSTIPCATLSDLVGIKCLVS